MAPSQQTQCPRCAQPVSETASVHVIYDQHDVHKVDAKIYTYTCPACRLSFTEEVREPAKGAGQ